MIGCPVSWKWRVGWRFLEPWQQPTGAQGGRRRKWTQVSPALRQFSQPAVPGGTSLIWPTCSQVFTYSGEPRSWAASRAVAELRFPALLGAVRATEDRAVGFDAVSDDPQPAAPARRRHGLDRAFQAVERVRHSLERDLE